MNTGEEIHLTQDNRFMCKEDFLAHTKNLCKAMSGKSIEFAPIKSSLSFVLSFLIALLQMNTMMIVVNRHPFSTVN
jgi:hypothetical protein